MTPDAAGRPERSDLTVDQHRMVAPSRVWLMPPPGDPTWYAGSWKSNPLTVVVGDVPYVPESEATRLRAERDEIKAVCKANVIAYADLWADLQSRAAELTALRAEVEASAKAVEALREEWEQSLPVLERLYRAVLDCAGPLGQEVVDSTYAYYDAVGRLHALLAARKGEG